MAAKHKFQHSTFRAQTTMDSDSLARLAKDVSEQVGNRSSRIAPYVRFEGAEPGRVLFSVRAWNGHAELMSFCCDIAGDPTSGSTTLQTHIQGFKTTQQKYMGLIPMGPKTMLGYGSYKKYAQALAQALQRCDPGSRGELVERPQLAGKH